MRKIVVVISISLDGYFEGLDRDISWHIVQDELHQYMNDYLGPMSAFLDGRLTHELMATYWPTADQEPNAPGPIVEFARIWRDMPKYVFSRTLQAQSGWNTTLRHEVDPDEIRQLKAQPGGDMAVGGPNLVQTFRRLGLIDEYHVLVHPVVLGRGHPLFPPSDTREPLRLLETRQFSGGVVLLRYATGPDLE